MKSWRPVVIICYAIGLAVVAGLLWAVLGFTRWHMSEPEELSPALIVRLKNLGMTALQSRDVPVAALLMYGDSVIGEGFNTELRDHNVGGHAEINALSDAMARLGPSGFSRLDRDSVVLVSTFEPCPMCRSALIENRIANVQFLKAKPFIYLLRQEIRALRYQWHRKKVGPDAIQDSLFHLHPGYK